MDDPVSCVAEPGWYREARQAFAPDPQEDRGEGFFIFRLLKQTANFVLGVNASSTYPAGTPAVHVSPAASLDSLFEQSEIARR